MSTNILVVIVSFVIPYFASGAPQASRRANDISDDIVSRLTIPDGAFCDKRVPAFMVLDNYKIKSTTSLPFKNMSENACAQMCSDNKDKHDKALLCSSFTYQKADRLCTIHRQKAKPAGQLELVEDDKFRYYEKFCLPVFAPLDCGESLFFRAEEAVLEGSALNATKAKKLESCIHTCIQRSDECKSAMYFDEVGECILNSGSAQELPGSFKEERKERVVYFENGCILGNQVRSQAKSGTEAPSKSITTDDSVTPLDGALAIDRAVEKLQEAEEEEHVSTAKPDFGKWSEWNECDRPDGRRIRKRTCTGSKQSCKDKIIESQWCDVAFVSTTETISSASTHETVSTDEPASTIENDSTSEQPATTEDPTTTEEPSTTDEPTTELKRTTNKPRKSTTTKKSNAEDDDQDSTASPIAFFDLLFTPPAVIPKSSGQWGPWTKNCQPFGQNQQCVEGKIVGFQERQCLKTPSECQGPFSRYCFIPCQKQG